MSILVATHDGPFHADDVMALALLRVFVDAEAQVVRTRDLARIAEADVVIDVGGVYDAATRRFDHHQATYTGPYSSAGMVLEWLIAEGRVAEGLGTSLRREPMAYLDAVDNGRRTPEPGVPCFPKIVDALNRVAGGEHRAFDAAYLQAVGFAEAWLRGLAAGHAEVEAARERVAAAMAAAQSAGTRILTLERYVPWKEPYFSAGGREHPTDYVLHPGSDGSWRLTAIPPEPGSMAQKRPLPAEWAGLTDEALEAVTGVKGSSFCHKNRFIASFKTREAALEAIAKWNLG